MSNTRILTGILFLCVTMLSQGSFNGIQMEPEDVDRLLQLESENQQLIETMFGLEQECMRLRNIIEAQGVENNNLRQRVFELESILNLQDAFDSGDNESFI